jgi:monoamine oxidase
VDGLLGGVDPVDRSLESSPPRGLNARIDPIFPGTRAAFTGAAYEDHWVRDPWVKGAYSFYKVGQYATYGPIAAAAEGRVHFAGEHTSINNQGCLDGAVATGVREAKEIVAQL